MHSRNFLSVAVCLLSALIIVHSLPRKHKPRGGNNQSSCDDPSERYHKATEQCFPTGLQGPCGDNMVFKEDKNMRHLGTCECQNSIGCEFWPFTYWEPANQCFPLYSQGPCKENEWLVHENHRHNRGNRPDKKIIGECKPRTCDPTLKPGRAFGHQGKCYEIATQAFCSTPQEQVYFAKGTAMPNCFNKPVAMESCQAGKQGGGTVQHISIITPPPPGSMSLSPSIPALVPSSPPPPVVLIPAQPPVSLIPAQPPVSLVPVRPLVPLSHPLPPMSPVPPPPEENLTPSVTPLVITTKTLGGAAVIPCGGGKQRSSTGDCNPTATFK